MITTVNKVSLAWFDKKSVHKSLRNETNFNNCEFTEKFSELFEPLLFV